jgi:hypothetical protein
MLGRGVCRHQEAEHSVRYECNPKHQEPWQPGRKGTLCPRDIDQAMAQQLLADSQSVGDKRYVVHGGRAYRAQQHGTDVWHGYPVGWVEVPEKLRTKWLAEGRVQRRNIREHWDE